MRDFNFLCLRNRNPPRPKSILALLGSFIKGGRLSEAQIEGIERYTSNSLRLTWF